MPQPIYGTSALLPSIRVHNDLLRRAFHEACGTNAPLDFHDAYTSFAGGDGMIARLMSMSRNGGTTAGEAKAFAEWLSRNNCKPPTRGPRVPVTIAIPAPAPAESANRAAKMQLPEASTVAPVVVGGLVLIGLVAVAVLAPEILPVFASAF